MPRPKWQIGQRWIVETTRKTAHIAARTPTASRPVRWQFTVLRQERVGGKNCFRVAIACRSVEGVPGMTIWVDTDTLALRQVETGLLVQGEVRWVTERYDSEDAGSPVIGVLSALPLELPVFSPRGSRSGRFDYRAVMGDDGDRPADDLAFAVAVEQSVTPARATPATYEVRLRSNGREVRQKWKSGLPWPSYSSSGGSTSRLVDVIDVVPVALEATPARRTAVVRSSTPSRSIMNVSGVDEGQARFTPWSGYWWKARDGGILSPLRKYDLMTGKRSADWERQDKDPRVAPPWEGYCHAWSAASVMEREPRAPRTVSGPTGRSITLSVADQKAWLTICHAQDEATPYGTRYNGSGDDPQDIYPDLLWRCLRLYVKQRGVPLIVDTDPGKQIWNYPVFRYRVTHRPHSTPGVRLGTMEIWMADDQVPPNFIGTKVKKKTYQFTFRMKGKALVMGSGRWYGASRQDHPDFAWYPTMVKPKNPHINPTLVRRMLGARNPSVAMRPAPQRPADLLRVRGSNDLLGGSWTTGMPE
jgi:hypothetical protein